MMEQEAKFDDTAGSWRTRSTGDESGGEIIQELYCEFYCNNGR